MNEKEKICPKRRISSENSSDDDLTPTNYEAREVFDNSIQDKVRLCVSPTESENSSGGSTPDANALNNAPFDVKLDPKSATKSKPPQTCSKMDIELSAEGFQTPEKVARPMNFKNLSPRTVRYEFSTWNSSGHLRPVKVRRSYQSLFDLSITESAAGTDQSFEFTPKRPCRAKSEDWSRVSKLSKISPMKRISHSNILDERLSSSFESDSERQNRMDDGLTHELQNLSVHKNTSIGDDDVF